MLAPAIRKPRDQGLVAGVLVFIATIAASIGVFAYDKEARFWVAHTYEVEDRLRALEQHITAAESAARAYSISSNREYLEHEIAAEQSVRSSLNSLIKLTESTPAQRAYTEGMRAAVEALLVQLETVLALGKHGDLTEVARYLNQRQGLVAMDEVRRHATEMRAEENRLLTSRLAKNNLVSSSLLVVPLAGSLIALIFLAIGVRRYERAADDLRKNESRLREQSENLKAILNNVVDGVVTIDQAGIIQSWNPSAARIFGYSASEAIGKDVAIIIADEYVKEHDELLNSHLQNEIPRLTGTIREIAGKQNGGLIIPIEISISKTLVNNQITFIEVIRDIAERKAAEKARIDSEAADAANRAKSRFLANMSHEIRTPMNGIIGMTDLALGTHLTRQQREYLQLVQSSAHALLGIINDILDFSRIEAGKFRLNERSFDLRESTGDLLKILAPKAQQKGLELICEISPHVPAKVMGDSGRIGQVLLNLISNAIKFTAKGEVKIEINRLQSLPERQVELEFSIRDSGIGIPKEQLATIFDPFVQVSNTATHFDGGTGLGLTISRQLANLMGGDLWVESQPQLGSTFHFTAIVKAVEEKTSAAARYQQFLGKNMLVVDDNASFLGWLTSLLREWHMTAVSADSLESALDQASKAARESRPFSMALIDSKLPGKTALTLARELRDFGISPECIIIMLTADDAGKQASEFAEAGFTSQVTKPMKESEIFELLLRVFHDRSESTQTPRSEGKRNADYRSLSILLAEDNPINQIVAKEFLTQWGHNVTLAQDGRKALDLLEKQTFDLILMDMQMPNVDGLAAVSVIRKEETTTGAHIPVIALTAQAMAGDKERCLASGFDDYISKPFDPDELRAKIVASYAAKRHACQSLVN